jgi:hypothetical protein
MSNDFIPSCRISYPSTSSISANYSPKPPPDQAPISFFTRLVKKTLKGEIYRSRPGTVDRQYHYQVMTVELVDEQLAMMGVEPPTGLAIKQEPMVVDDVAVAELLVLRDRVLVRGMLLGAAVARYSGITSKLLLDEDSINGSVDVGVDCAGGGDYLRYSQAE